MKMGSTTPKLAKAITGSTLESPRQIELHLTVAGWKTSVVGFLIDLSPPSPGASALAFRIIFTRYLTNVMKGSAMTFVAPILPRGAACSVTKVVSKRRRVLASAQPPSSTAHTTFNVRKFSEVLYKAQQSLCSQLEAIDGQEKFCSDPWKSENGSGGNTRGKELLFVSSYSSVLSTSST